MAFPAGNAAHAIKDTIYASFLLRREYGISGGVSHHEYTVRPAVIAAPPATIVVYKRSCLLLITGLFCCVWVCILVYRV